MRAAALAINKRDSGASFLHEVGDSRCTILFPFQKKAHPLTRAGCGIYVK